MAYQWKTLSNPDQAKQAHKVTFSRTTNKIIHPSLDFNNATVNLTHTQKYLDPQLDSKLSFNEHANKKISKEAKDIKLLRKLQSILQRRRLSIIHKSFIRPHLEYGDVVYDQSSNASFLNKIESVQYDTVLAITGTIKGPSCDKVYHELGFEYRGDCVCSINFF